MCLKTILRIYIFTYRRCPSLIFKEREGVGEGAENVYIQEVFNLRGGRQGEERRMTLFNRFYNFI